MEYATEAYKEAMKANVRGKSYVWVSLDMINTYAQESAYVSSAFSGSETGLYDDSKSVNTITSAESDGSITFTFGEYTKLLLSGVRFILNGSFTTVTATNGSQSKTVNVVEDEVTVDQTFTNCHYIKLTPDSGSLSLKKVYFGKTINFDHDEIMNTSRSNTIRHLNEELPEKNYSFTVHNYDRLWNKDNPDSLARFVMAKQKVTYRYGRDVDGEIYEIVGGIVYLSSFSSDDYKASFVGVGLLDYLKDDYTKGAFYPDGITLYQLAELVMIDAGITNYELDACLRSFKVTNPLPLDTHKACLQLIAHAGRCILYEDRNGAVCLKSADRPVIYKTGYVINATNFSKGDDVVNPLTVANYASTEPSYTYADGLQYFYPEGNELKDNNLVPYDDSRTEIYDVSISTDDDGYISFSGINSYYGYRALQYRLRSSSAGGSELIIPPGEYIFGAYPSRTDSSIETSYGVERSGSDFNAHGYYAVLYLGNIGNPIYSYDSLSKRKITVNRNTRIYADVYIFERDCTYDFFPRLLRVGENPHVADLNTLPVGFVSEEFANSSGTFTNTPEIQVVFASPCKMTEIVMNCAVPPKDFTIKCYLKDTQVASRSITDNTEPQLEVPFTNLVCDKFTVTFTKTTAGQRIHVNSVEPVAAFDYEITYKDITMNPIATEIEKVSRLKCEIYKYADPKTNQTSYSGVSITTEEIEGGGLSVDINSGTGILAYVEVIKGENLIDIGNPSIVDTVEYADDIEGGIVEIVDKGAYFVRINASRDGYVNVKGTEYFENIVNHYIPVNEIGEEVTVTNPLISTEEHYEKLKSWFLDYYENDIEYRFDYRGDPILDADDQIFLENKFVTNNLIRIESEDLSTSAGMDTSNQITARRMKYTTVSKTVLRDFVLSNDILYLDNGQNTTLSVIEWIPNTVTNKTITWSSSDPSIVTIDSNGKVMPLAEGEVTITATSSNGITHTCRVVSTASTIEVTDFEISESEISVGVGSTQRLYVVSWTPSDASLRTVEWTSSDDTVASVDSLGNVTGVGEGTAVITATCPDGISKTCDVTAAVIVATNFTLSASIASLKIGETKQLSVTSWTPSNATNKTITWSTSDSTKATVSSDGLITAISDGNVTITATSADGVSKTCALTVSHVAVTDFTLSKSSLEMQIGDSVQLLITSWTPSNAKYKSVTWSTSNADKATVSENGVVTAIANGSVTITATCPDGISKTCELTVADVEVIDFTLSTSSETVEIGETLQLSVSSWIPSNATHKTVTWTSSDTSIATVSENGLVTALDDGNVTITATCPDGISKTCSIEVPYIAVTNISLSNTTANMTAGNTMQLRVTSWSPADATNPTFSWSSSDDSIATVDNNGVVTALVDGTVSITASCDGATKSCKITVQRIPVTDFTLSSSSETVDMGDTFTLSVTSWTPENATRKTVTWESSDESKATVSASGVVTTVGVGAVNITATCPDGISKTCAVTVNAVPVTDFTLSQSSASLNVGNTLQLSVSSWTPANASYKTVTWSSSDTSKATVSDSGLITAVADGNVTITATCPDGISKTCTVAVTHIAVTNFTLSQTSATVDVGDTLQLSVTSWTPNNATYKTVTWSSSDTTKATVNSSGLVTGIAEGNITITATCPDGISKTCSITVFESDYGKNIVPDILQYKSNSYIQFGTGTKNYFVNNTVTVNNVVFTLNNDQSISVEGTSIAQTNTLFGLIYLERTDLKDEDYLCGGGQNISDEYVDSNHYISFVFRNKSDGLVGKSILSSANDRTINGNLYYLSAISIKLDCPLNNVSYRFYPRVIGI